MKRLVKETAAVDDRNIESSNIEAIPELISSKCLKARLEYAKKYRNKPQKFRKQD